MKKLIILFIAVVGFGVSSFGQVATVNGTATATLITPISITADRNLAFGVMASSGTDGVVVISNEATATRLNSDGNVDLVGGAFTSAQFTVKCQASNPFTFVLPSSTVEITAGSGSDKLSVTSFTQSAHGTTATEIIYVGASITIPSTAVVGSYTGTFAVTAAYN